MNHIISLRLICRACLIVSDGVVFKFILIKERVGCGVAEVYSMSCLLIQLPTDSIQSVAIGGVVGDR
jgi:hypothetical protein